MSTAPRDHSLFDDTIAGRSFDLRLVLRLLRWVRPHRGAAIASLALVLLSASFAVLAPVVLSRVVIDGLLRGEATAHATSFGMRELTAALAETAQLPPLSAALCLFGALLALQHTVAHAHRVLLVRAVLRALHDLRRDLFRHLMLQPASFYDRVAVGRVMTRVTNDVEVLFQLLTGFGFVFGQFVPFFVALALMSAISPALTGLLLLALPIVALGTFVYRRTTRRVYRAIRNGVSRLNQHLQETLSGREVVQLHGREAHEHEAYAAIDGENRRNERTAMTVESLYEPFIGTLASFGIAVVIWFGGQRVLAGVMTLGGVVMFAQYIDMLIRPIVALGEQYNVVFRAMASAERIFQALDWDESIPDPERPRELPARLRGAVEFRDVRFGYDPGREVLHGVSFGIAPGEKLAIVGTTGSGKTTLIRLLGRFYAHGEGQIFLDGVDLYHVRPRDVRRRLGVVLQDFHVFAGTVYDNIALGDPAVTRELAERAARLVHADAFIRALPHGYDTRLDERGQNLSHGQRQLLAFARVLASDPEILILDEATASIDPETEHHIRAALRTVTEGRTSILIAHRLQTVREADRIVVLEHGRVREIGSHEELLAKGGAYLRLYELQFAEDEAAA